MARRNASVATARTAGPRASTITAVATVVILAVMVFGGVFFFRGSPGAPAAIAPVRVGASYPSVVQGDVVLAGSASAPRTLDVYEDALCPACRQFEALDGQKITDALDAGRVQVRYHLVNLLDQQSRPAGYSTAAGNAILCAAENGGFANVHASLYGAQPEEGSAGYTTEQLASLGSPAGAGPGYTGCVQNGIHAAAMARNLAQATSDPALAQPGSGGSSGFGTPTLVSSGTVLEPGSPQLDALLGP